MKLDGSGLAAGRTQNRPTKGDWRTLIDAGFVWVLEIL